MNSTDHWVQVPMLRGRQVSLESRDTVIFSIIDAEWAGVKRHLQFRLDSHS